MDTKWKVLPIPDVEKIENIACQCNVSRLLAVLLLVRGIDSDKANDFINNDEQNLLDPFLFRDMKKAVSFINSYVENGRRITIYGDYDADGVTATALLVKALKKIGAKVDYYIPQRDIEGYGVSKSSIDTLNKRGTELIITVDCGITAVVECLYAKTLGIEMIITDHHECSDIMPEAVAVIDAKSETETYPHSSLAGVGVALKLAQALLATSQSYLETAEEYSELVAIGSIADIVPMLGENRFLCQLGIKKLNDNIPLWLEKMLTLASSDFKIDTTKVGFVIAPRINASGRITNASYAIELLLENNYDKLNELAQKLDDFNGERQRIEAQIFLEAEKLYLENYIDNSVVVLFNDKWHHGVVGIVSSRLTKKYMKPFILISPGVDGNCKGSGRSIEGFSLYKALENSKDAILSFGGHELAAGVVISREKIDDFRKLINLYADEYFKLNEIENIICADCELKGRHLNIETIKELSLLEPYGTQNNKPLFFIRNMKILSVYCIGNNKQHLKFTFIKDGITIDGVAFNYEVGTLMPNSVVSVMCYLEINDYKNNYAPQLRIIDIKGEIYG
ncbi:MAG: single-stranded-DNA-specific exonuclease RecJ [Clostridia bacterium]|nr:single-stranded-DNA-specific exonuclease RecJ [Clostridia bacterium]